MQVVWAGDIIAVVIGRDAARAIGVNIQVDPQTAIRENRVTKHGVVDRSVAKYPYSDEIRGTTHAAVECDDVACVRGRAAHCTVVTANRNAAHGVAQWICPCDVGADDVALDDRA